MHRVVKAHLTAFQAKYGLENEDQSKQFEAFVNHAVFRSHCAENVDPNDLIYQGDDPGVDGVMIFVDDAVVSSPEEVDDIFADRKRDAEVVIVFTQSKTSENWSKSEINTFQSAVVDFLDDEPKYPRSEYLVERREVFDAVIAKVGKIRNGKPACECYFATTARQADEREILAARRALKDSVEDMGLFSTVDVVLLDRDSVVELWKAADGQTEATLPILGSAAFPKAPGVEEGYVVTVRVKDFINQILSDGNGRLRQQIFEENVRDFIGLDSEINSEMAATVVDPLKQKRFGILNNGITIISPDVRLAGLEIFLRDFQIVNGCQTSNVLFSYRLQVSEDATLMLKVVETSDPGVVDDIVRSTNRQAKVEEDQFLATLDAVKALERYFNARGADDEYRLFFERRKNQFASIENAKAIRIFDIKELSRCVAAMFLDRPEIASRYPNRLTGEMRSSVFNKLYKEEIYHVSAYALYRLKLLLSNHKLQKYSKLRWHILMAIKYFVLGGDVPQMSSAKMVAACGKIEEFMARNDEEAVNQIKGLCGAIVNIEDITRDKLRGSALTQEVKTKALAIRAEMLRSSK
jgi:hypothetical protein